MQKKDTILPNAPKSAPKAKSKIAPMAAAEVAPDATPKQSARTRPQRSPIIAPVSTPETSTLSPYFLPHWEADHSTSPHRYGNGGKSLGEFHTEGDAKDWLARNGHYGHFALVERINGRIMKSWHIEIEPWEEEPEDDLGMLDEDDLDDAQLLNPDVVRAKIENAKLKAELKALSQNGGQGSFVEMLEAVKMLDEMRGQRQQPKTLAEQLREVKEINELINPRREQPQPQQPQQSQLSEEEVLLKTILSADGGKLIDRIGDGLLKKVMGEGGTSATDSWLDFAKDALASGQAAEIVKAAFGGIGSLFSSVMPIRPQPMQPTIQPTAAQQQQPQQQQQQPEQPQQPPETQPQDSQVLQMAIERMVGRILPAMAINGDVILISNTLVSFCDVFPEQRPMIDGWMSAPAENLLAMLGQMVPGAAQVIAQPHALDWMQRLQTAYLNSEDEPETEGTENEKGAEDGTTTGQ